MIRAVFSVNKQPHIDTYFCQIIYKEVFFSSKYKVYAVKFNKTSIKISVYFTFDITHITLFYKLDIVIIISCYNKLDIIIHIIINADN